MSKTEVFISYAWGNTEQADGANREKVVNDLFTSLQNDNIDIIRDRNVLIYGDLISAFMDRIGEGYSIIVVISDKYLRSEFCLYEFSQIFKNSGSNTRKMQAKIFPIVLQDAKIYGPGDVADYVKYWQKQKDDLIQSAQTIDPENRIEQDKKIKLFSEIALNMGEWITLLASMLASGASESETAEDFKILKARIKARLDSLAPVLYNQALYRRLIEALATFDDSTYQLLTEARKRMPEWEKIKDNRTIYREKIIESFPGVIGNQLSEVINIGARSDNDEKLTLHIDTCIMTAKRGLQLLFFSFLVKFWDHVDKTGPFAYQPAERAALEGFFQYRLEPGVNDYYQLLRTMTAIFDRITEDAPFPEMDWHKALRDESPISIAVRQLQTIQDAVYTKDLSLQAEQAIAAIFSELAFLSTYKMVSVKNIGYYSLRNSKPHYLHEYSPIGVYEQVGPSSAKPKRQVKYVDLPTYNDVVMLYKDKYWTGINLFPFIIDVNALRNEELAEVLVAFYTSWDPGKQSFRYSMTDSDSILITSTDQDLQDVNRIDQLFIDKEGKIKINESNVARQISEAKEKILR